MPHPRSVAEDVLTALLLVWLFWLPLPFGSVTDAAQPALVIPPLIFCALAALLRIGRPATISRPLRIWSAAAALFVAIVLLQLVPLPNAVVAILSPESHRIRTNASRLAAMVLGTPAPSFQPITVDASVTTVHLFRILAYAATFLAAAILFRRHRRRVALAIALACAATFEALYGIREMLMHRYAIWGWVNTLIFDRVTGTFVNPNHFAHYAAIVLPMPLFVMAMAWHDAAPPAAKIGRRIVRLVESKMISFGVGAIGAFACVAAMLISQSRGALLAAIAGCTLTGALSSGRRHAARRAILIVIAAGAVIVLIVMLLGAQQTVSRFGALSADVGSSFGGRAVDLQASLAVWKRFPIFGSGLGTFDTIVSITGVGPASVIINHAHDDYAEIAATTGSLGFAASVLLFVAGFLMLARLTVGSEARDLPWPRRAFRIAALASISAAMIHAFVDFNFFIPANPATLAAIAGAAVAIKEPR